MTLGWGDMFVYGRWEYYSVSQVWLLERSYLVWTVAHTSNRFTEEVMAALDGYVARGVNTNRHGRGLTSSLIVNYFKARQAAAGVPW